MPRYILDENTCSNCEYSNKPEYSEYHKKIVCYCDYYQGYMPETKDCQFFVNFWLPKKKNK
jgi:hypothetical protein